eukprot:2505437-Prymnesium_polylepis.1
MPGASALTQRGWINPDVVDQPTEKINPALVGWSSCGSTRIFGELISGRGVVKPTTKQKRVNPGVAVSWGVRELTGSHAPPP